MTPAKTKRELGPGRMIQMWGHILTGSAPMLSIEITRECPLHCPGCYAYGDTHLGGEVTLRQLSDLKGDALVDGVIGLVRKHRPLHVSLVGGEPLVRARELHRILPALSELGVHAMVVTSAVAPIPEQWMHIPRVLVTVSVDGLPEDHDVRREPATYERILRNIAGRRVNVHWTITRPMLKRPTYLEEYVSFWNARPELNRMWVSIYSPQQGEQSPEMLTREDRARVIAELLELRKRYPKLLFNEGLGAAFLAPPQSPEKCTFAKMSVNYSADLQTRVEPCIFGGTPDCSQCGCAISVAAHHLPTIRLFGPLKIGHLVNGSIAIGSFWNRLKRGVPLPSRWKTRASAKPRRPDFVQLGT